MKSRNNLVLMLGVLIPVFIAVPVFAVDGADTGSTQNTTTTKPNTQTQTDATKKAELQARLQKRKAAQKAKLTTIEQKRLETKCKGGQGVVKSLQAKINGTETSRNQVYGNLVDRLTKLEVKLAAAGANTAELKAEIATLQTKIATFKTDLAAYKVLVADLVDMDCATDPAGFKASLEEARAGLKKVQADGLDIKAYVNDTIKPTLTKLRAEVAKDKKTEN